MPDPPFFGFVDWAYNTVIDSMPEFLNERPMFSALALGYLGNRAAVQCLQLASKGIDRLKHGFDDEYFPAIEYALRTGISIAPFIYGLVDPEGAKAIVSQHPVYTAGMAGAYVGALHGFSRDLSERNYKGISLDSIVNKLRR